MHCRIAFCALQIIKSKTKTKTNKRELEQNCKNLHTLSKKFRRPIEEGQALYLQASREIQIYVNIRNVSKILVGRFPSWGEWSRVKNTDVSTMKTLTPRYSNDDAECSINFKKETWHKHSLVETVSHVFIWCKAVLTGNFAKIFVRSNRK